MKSALQNSRTRFRTGLFHTSRTEEITTTHDTQFYPSELCAFYPDRTYSGRLLRFVGTDGWPFYSYRSRAGLSPVQSGAKLLMGDSSRRICPLVGFDKHRVGLTAEVQEIGTKRSRSFLTHY